jgi:hypothetical protein
LLDAWRFTISNHFNIQHLEGGKERGRTAGQ